MRFSLSVVSHFWQPVPLVIWNAAKAGDAITMADTNAGTTYFTNSLSGRVKVVALMLAYILFVVIAPVVIATLPTPGHADEYDLNLAWQTRKGALLCPDRFRVKDALAGAVAGDLVWL